MKTKQMTFQKIVLKSSYILCALTFAYSLIFATPFYQFFILDSLFPAEAALFDEIQPFNSTLFTLSAIYIILCVVQLIFFAQSRRKYYLSNYISGGVFVGYSAFIAIFGFSGVLDYYTKFTAIDFEFVVKLGLEKKLLNSASQISDSTITFIIGFIIFALVIITSLMIIANFIWKAVLSRREIKEFADIDAQIRENQAQKERELLEEAEA